jgi:hypothetical protein
VNAPPVPVVEESIAKLALYFTAPSYWLDGHSDKLRDFLHFLLDTSRPGFAALGVKSDGDDLHWLQHDDALAQITSFYTQVWSLAEAHFGNSEIDEDLFDRLLGTKAVVFVDQVRFDACCSVLPPGVRASGRFKGLAGSYWIGLTIDWAYPEGAISWFPQFRVYSYWPDSRQFAPPRADRPVDVGVDSESVAPTVAAEILDAVYWKEIGANFHRLREHFDLGTANTGDFESPVFYVAEPSSAPATPEEYMQDEWWNTLAALSESNLYIQDPFADKVVTAILNGRFVVLSTALRSTRGQRQDYYLILPTDAGGPEGQGLREIQAAAIADQLAFIHFSASKTANDVMTDATVLQQQIRVQAYILAHARDTAEQILAAVSGGKVKLKKADGDLRQLAREFQLVVERMKLQFTKSELAIQEMETSLTRGKSGDAEDLARRLDIRRARTGRSMSGEGLAPTVVATDRIENLSREGTRERRSLGQLKATFDGVLAHVEQGEREREERAQKTLSYLLVFLAAVVAFPLLIGHMSWIELGAVLNRRSTIGQIVWNTHAVVTWVSVGAAFSGIVVLAFYLLLRSERFRRIWALGPMRSHDMHRSRDEVAALWLELSEDRRTEEQKGKAALVRDDLDQKIAIALAAESDWLLENAIDEEHSELVKNMRARVAVIGALSEVFMQRPNPLLLPITLIVIRLCGPRFFRSWVGSNVVSDYELMYVLVYCGMSREQAVDLIGRIAGDERLRTARTTAELVPGVEDLLFGVPSSTADGAATAGAAALAEPIPASVLPAPVAAAVLREPATQEDQ